MPRILVFLVAILASCVSCAPVGSNRRPRFLAVVVHNDVAYVETFTLTHWYGGVIAGIDTRVVAPFGKETFLVTPTPQGFEINAAAWPPGGGYVLGVPDYEGWWIYNVQYPQGARWGELPTHPR